MYVLFMYMFVFPIITQDPRDRFASYFDYEILVDHGNVLSLGLRF